MRPDRKKALAIAQQRPEKHLKQILHCTRGIVFLGTPHHGSGLALWAEKLAKTIGLIKQTNPEILSVLRRDSEVLARVQDGFHTMIRSRAQGGLPPIEITCFYEQLPLPGVGTVCGGTAFDERLTDMAIRSLPQTLPFFQATYPSAFMATTST
jgi:hypothetical protein